MNQASLECPVCSEYIYDLYKCKNGHSVCGECWIKPAISHKGCPICRDPKLTDSNNELQNITKFIPKRRCRFSERGCSKTPYIFDENHENSCYYRDFLCVFCKSSFPQENGQISTSTVRSHYENGCVNQFQILVCDSVKPVEKVGHKFKLTQLQLKPSLIVVQNQYCVIALPQQSSQKLKLYVFSTELKYKHSNHTIDFLDLTQNEILKKVVAFKEFEPSVLDLARFVSSDQSNGTTKTLQFIVQNNFLINRKIKAFEQGNVYYRESYYVDGEPGSPGNWTKEDYDDITKKFTDLFTKFKK